MVARLKLEDIDGRVPPGSFFTPGWKLKQSTVPRAWQGLRSAFEGVPAADTLCWAVSSTDQVEAGKFLRDIRYGVFGSVTVVKL